MLIISAFIALNIIFSSINVEMIEVGAQIVRMMVGECWGLSGNTSQRRLHYIGVLNKKEKFIIA